MHQLCVYSGDELAAYNFGNEHPFGPLRLSSFMQQLSKQGLTEKVCLCKPQMAERTAIESFHDRDYVTKVERLSHFGLGMLDQGDTPAFNGMFEAASYVVGSVLDAVQQIMSGACRHAFVPIAGLHHARRHSAAGFCVFNDCGIAIEQLRRAYAIKKVAYVDIDAHHGDGVFYSFNDDPDLCFVDFHEDGQYLYPGSGAVQETGDGVARGTKLNIPMPPGADDELFMQKWPAAEKFIERARPEFILLQCGADSIKGDPITHMQYTIATHAFVTQRLKAIADRLCSGRLLAMGGGGYDLDNIARAWCTVVSSLLSKGR
jgi:acetoin utilization protein AcuC